MIEEKFYIVFTVGAKELREKLEFVDQDLLSVVIADLKGICQALGAAGMAANQIGHRSRVCVVRLKNRSVQVMVNPRIQSVSDETVRAVEGCISIPGYKIQVVRHKEVLVKFYDEHGSEVEALFCDDEARCVQHEIDHLDGVLISDRGSRMFGESKLKAAVRKFKDHQYKVSELGVFSNV